MTAKHKRQRLRSVIPVDSLDNPEVQTALAEWAQEDLERATSSFLRSRIGKIVCQAIGVPWLFFWYIFKRIPIDANNIDDFIQIARAHNVKVTVEPAE